MIVLGSFYVILYQVILFFMCRHNFLLYIEYFISWNFQKSPFHINKYIKTVPIITLQATIAMWDVTVDTAFVICALMNYNRISLHDLSNCSSASLVWLFPMKNMVVVPSFVQFWYRLPPLCRPRMESIEIWRIDAKGCNAFWNRTHVNADVPFIMKQLPTDLPLCLWLSIGERKWQADYVAINPKLWEYQRNPLAPPLSIVAIVVSSLVSTISLCQFVYIISVHTATIVITKIPVSAIPAHDTFRWWECCKQSPSHVIVI